MAKFDYVLLDLDKTLFDFNASEVYSLSQALKDVGYEYDENSLKLFQKINQALWRRYDSGEIPHNYVKFHRFDELFKTLNFEGDFKKAGELFTSYLSTCNHLTDYAFELCEILSNYCTLAVVTNGFSKTQHKRLENSSIEPFFDYIFISDEIGFQKPKPEFFNHVFSEMKLKDKDKTIIIGDSLISDISGGINAGIKTCWFNPNKEKNNSDIIPNFEVEKLKEVENIVYK